MQTKTTPYIILPFKFERFANQKVLVVNECGEFMFLQDRDFRRFVSYDLGAKEDLFLDLKE